MPLARALKPVGGSVVPVLIASQLLAAADSPPTAATGKGRLSYDLASDQYTFAWKTKSAWEDTTRQLPSQFDGGTTHTAKVRFR